MNIMYVFNALTLLGVIVSAICAVAFRNVLSSVIALASVGAFLALEFILLEAPDVAIAEAAVGAVLSTVLFVVAIRKTTPREEEEK